MKYGRSLVLASVFCVSVLVSTPAFAYLDPGSSGLILQAILGAIAAGFVAIKIYWRRFWSALTGRGKKRPPDEIPGRPGETQ